MGFPSKTDSPSCEYSRFDFDSDEDFNAFFNGKLPSSTLRMAFCAVIVAVTHLQTWKTIWSSRFLQKDAATFQHRSMPMNCVYPFQYPLLLNFLRNKAVQESYNEPLLDLDHERHPSPHSWINDWLLSTACQVLTHVLLCQLPEPSKAKCWDGCAAWIPRPASRWPQSGSSTSCRLLLTRDLWTVSYSAFCLIAKC